MSDDAEEKEDKIVKTYSLAFRNIPRPLWQVCIKMHLESIIGGYPKDTDKVREEDLYD